MAIIGISGKAQAGKDTAGGHLNRIFQGKRFINEVGWMQQEPYSKPWTMNKFAGKLKDSIQFKFPNLFNTQKWEEGGDEYRNEYLLPLNMTRRELLIEEAMALRGICKDYWVAALMNEYTKQTLEWDEEGNSLKDGYPNWIITDLRFENEFKAIKSIGGICIRIERQDIPIIDSISETSLDVGFVFDYTIHNNESELELIEKLQITYESIKSKL